MDHLLASIIVPAKNRKELLMETLRSVQEQSHSNWEVVVVDDDSSDGTWEMLQEMASIDQRVRSIRRTGDTGGSAVARNQGFSASRGEFVLFLDSDDLLARDAIKERLEKFLAAPEADAVVGDTSYFRTTPTEYENEHKYLLRPEGRQHQLEYFLTMRSPWITSGPLWRRAAVEKTGPWRSTYAKANDNEYHTYALLQGVTFVYLGKVDWYWRLHGKGHLSSPTNFDLVAFNRAVDGKIAALGQCGLFSNTNRRMLAWSYLTHALDYSVYQSNGAISEALEIWEASRRRKLPNRLLDAIAPTLIRMQWRHICGTLPREIARLLLYVDLNVKRPFSPEAVRAIDIYIHYMITHWENYRSAQQLRHRTAQRLSANH